MARSRRKNGSCTRGRYKRKKMGKGWVTARKVPTGSRPVLKITEPEAEAK